MIKFCHISPTPHLASYTATNGAHLILAHLVEEDESYRNFYATLDDGKKKIMDNSAFEMFKQGRPMYDSAKLIDMGKACAADVIVMSDYPKQHWEKTVEAAQAMSDDIHDAGFDTFFVPQSELGDVEGLLKSIDWALENEQHCDMIGLSILACPIALGVNESSHHGEGARSDAYKLQRFLSRWKILTMLRDRRLLDDRAWKRFHCLGMVDGPNEIELLREFHRFIYSWDSSAAVWAGMNNIVFDGSPTGLMNGKFEKEVDFNAHSTYDDKVNQNINYINKLCR